MSFLYELLANSDSSDDKNPSKSSSKEDKDMLDIQFDNSPDDNENDIQFDNQPNNPELEINNQNDNQPIINDLQQNSSEEVKQTVENEISNSDLTDKSIAGFQYNFDSSDEQSEKSENNSRSFFNNIYPILSNTFLPKELQVYKNFQYPLDGTIIYIGWENAIINSICSNCNDINSIRSFVLGSWFLDSSGQFIQFNYFNLSIFLSIEVLKETNLFDINSETKAISLSFDVSFIKNSNNFSFVFSKKDLTFNSIILNEAHNLLEHKNRFSLEELNIILNQKPYRTPVNTYEYITKDDLYRIQYIIDQSPYFRKIENGVYSKGEMSFGSFIESELTSNEAVNAMIKSFPIGHCFYKSELKYIITKKNGIQFSENEIVSHERVFYCSGRFGIRPNLQFRKQPRIKYLNDSNVGVLNNVILKTFSEISQPISIATLFSVINGKKYFYEIGSNSTKTINDRIHSNIRSFINTQPFIICKNNEFFTVPKICECDQFGHIYLCLLRSFIIKYGNQINESLMLSKFNELRFPIKKNEAVFTQVIQEAPIKIANFLKIPKIDSISNDFNDDYPDLFNTNENDGGINKNAFISSNSMEFEENEKFSQISLNKTNNVLSNDFLQRAKRKKILLDNIPDQQMLKKDEDGENEEDDFENDETISDLEKMLIRLAKKYYNPRILTYSTPDSFVDQLIGQKTTNKDGKEFTINNDSETIELVSNELLRSKRFTTNKEQKKFCYTGKIDINSNIIIHNSLSNDKLSDNNENDEDIFSRLTFFNNSSESENEGKKKNDFYSYSENYSASNSDVSDSYIGVDVELNKWEPPKLRYQKSENDGKSLSFIRDEDRNLAFDPIEFAPRNLIDRRLAIKERLKALHNSKDHSIPSKHQIFSLFLEFGNGMTIQDFVNYIIEIEGIIFAESH